MERDPVPADLATRVSVVDSGGEVAPAVRGRVEGPGVSLTTHPSLTAALDAETVGWVP